MKLEYQASAEVDQPIEAVWDYVTDSRNLGYILHVSWHYGHLDRRMARPGTAFGSDGTL